MALADVLAAAHQISVEEQETLDVLGIGEQVEERVAHRLEAWFRHRAIVVAGVARSRAGGTPAVPAFPPTGQGRLLPMAASRRRQKPPFRPIAASHTSQPAAVTA